MNKRTLSRTTIKTRIVILLLMGTGGLWLRAQLHQHDLNHDLLAALLLNNNHQALVLVNAGADPNTLYEPSESLSDNPFRTTSTAFIMASRMDDVSLILAMLKHGANPNAVDSNGETPLMESVSAHHSKTVGLLLDHGANVNYQDVAGGSALENSVMGAWGDDDVIGKAGDDEKIAIIRQLLAHGADPNLPDTYGTTPLKFAEQHRSPEIAALLRKAGAKK